MSLSGNTGGGASAGAIKAGEAFFEITGNDEALKKMLHKNVERVKAFAHTISHIGLGIAGIGGAVFAPLTAAFKTSLDRAANAQKLANKLGSTAEAVTALGFAAEHSGIDIETFVAANTHLQKTTLEAAKGSADQAAAFALLGTSAQDFSKLPLEEKYLAIADALSKIENPLERTMLLTGLFGKSFNALLPLLKKGREGIKELMVEAEELGAVINSDDAKNALVINKELSKVWHSMENVLLEVGLSVLGFKDDIKEASKFVLEILKNVREFIRENRQTIATVFLVSAALVAGGTALSLFGFGITGIIAGITSLISIGGTLIGALFSPLMLKIVSITAVIAGLTYAFTEFTETGQKVKEEFISAWNDIKTAFFDAWEGIVAALQKGDLELAGEIAMAGLKVAWQAGLLFLTQQWMKFKKTIIDGWLQISDAVENMVLGFQVAFTFITEGKEAAMKLGNELGAQLDEMAKEDAKRREEFRKGQMDEAQAELADAKKRLKELIEKAKEPKKEPPKVVENEEKKRREMAISLGDSVKGTFTSADFKGALGLGKANEAAKKQYEIMKQQLAVLIDINKKIEPGVFQ